MRTEEIILPLQRVRDTIKSGHTEKHTLMRLKQDTGADSEEDPRVTKINAGHQRKPEETQIFVENTAPS